MSSEKDQFDKWVEMWEKAAPEFSKDPPKKNEPHSFFGFGTSGPKFEELDLNETKHWNDVIKRQDKLFGKFVVDEKCDHGKKPKDGTYTDVDDDGVGDDEGFGKDLTKPGKDVKFNANPIHFASKGKDMKLRVGKFATASKELKRIIELKHQLHDLEDRFNTHDGFGAKQKAESIRKQIDSVKKEIDRLSDMLSPDPKTDVI